jgi:hypothetical protein
MKDFRRTLDIAVILSLVPIAVLIVFVAIFVLYPYKTLEVYNVTAKTPIVNAGENLIYTVDYCKFTNASSVVFRTLHSADDTSIVPFPSVMTVSVKGCHKVDVPLTIYKETPPGIYYMAAVAIFKINSLRDISVSFRSNNFEIK